MSRALVAVLAVAGCAAAPPAPSRPAAMTVEPVRVAHAAPRPQALEVELFYKGDQPFARRGDEEWALADVLRPEMVFAPDGKRFAYVRQRSGGAGPRTHIVVRNLAGDPVNDFPAYRAGALDELTWIDDRHICYVAPPEPAVAGAPRRPTNAFVVHDVNTGEVLAARSGVELVWSPQHRHAAFLAGAGGRQALVVDGRQVWPRAGGTRVARGPVWSSDGHGLALVEDGPAGPRLVVLVEYRDPGGDLTWPVPRDALAPGLGVFWAGDSKVVIGETALRPRFAADWQRLQ
jgi:hypothetical protein